MAFVSWSSRRWILIFGAWLRESADAYVPRTARVLLFPLVRLSKHQFSDLGSIQEEEMIKDNVRRQCSRDERSVRENDEMRWDGCN